MTDLMDENSFEKWFRSVPVQNVDVSEAFVGIGKLMFNGHSLASFVFERYSIDHAALPLSLVKAAAEDIAQSLKIAGFRGSFLLFFEDEEERRAPAFNLCATD